MALIVYPTDNYDSFVSLEDATTAIGTYSLQSPNWLALSTTDQEIYLRIAFRNIIDNTDPEVFPIGDIDSCVATAQSLMASQDVYYGLSIQDGSDKVGAIKKEKALSFETEYYESKNGRAFTPRVPAIAVACLSSIGYVFPTGIGGLDQITLGKS
jgi:hypothetical protein